MNIFNHSRFGGLWRTLCIIGVFVLISLVYFAPAVLESRDIYQPDVAGASGTAQDVRDYYEATGETSYWTNSLFGGMPMYQIAPSYPSLSVIKGLQDFLTMQMPFKLLPSYSWLIFAMLVGFFIFMRSLAVGRLASALGAIMWAFSSYFIILIAAGHIWKLTVLAFIPPTIAGIIYIFKRRYLLGGVLTTFFAALQLMSNHIQMSYYFGFVIAFLLVGYSVEAARQRDWRHLLKAFSTVAVAAVLSIAMNASNLYHTYEYTQETMRGGSALSSDVHGKSRGLDKEYITAWSYGKAETITLLIPNAYGGATGYLGENSEAMSNVQPELRQVVGQMNHYWGDQPFTAGPVYVGAFVLLLFVLGAFIVSGTIKWVLLSATALSIALSWGHNMMWLTDLFIDYFPLYNKFRTVSSILVIAEFTIPTLAILALITFIKDPKAILGDHVAIGASLGVTLGAALLIALFPSTFFTLMSTQESEMFRQYMTDPQVQVILSALKDVRAGIVSSDAWRSVGVITVSLLVCYLHAQGKVKVGAMLSLLIAVTLIDLWMLDKRYLGEKDFIDTSAIAQRATPVSAVDKAIAQDTEPHYRVYNMAVSSFNDATTSYMHRSIGGYHAAKLARYQDLIERQISQGNRSVLNMLNTRYIISKTPDNQLTYMRNEEAQGPAWFVDMDRVKVVPDANSEMEALGQLDLRHEAVMNIDQGISPMAQHNPDSAYTPRTNISLQEYTPNRVRYAVETDRERLFVMSDIYYSHGWVMTINGEEAEIKRANYVLRAAVVPAGQHIIELKFIPTSVQTTELIAWIAQLILLVGIGWLAWRSYRSVRTGLMH